MKDSIPFLSRDNIVKHKEYLKRLKLEYAIIEKSYADIYGLPSDKILKSNLERRAKLEAYASKLEIELHELFFSSFFEKNMKAKLPFYNNSSQAGFLYEAEREAVLGDGLFLIICKSNKGVICKSLIRTYAEFPESKPLLCIDLCEHSYFSDYSFDKRRYVREALLHLNFNKMN